MKTKTSVSGAKLIGREPPELVNAALHTVEAEYGIITEPARVAHMFNYDDKGTKLLSVFNQITAPSPRVAVYAFSIVAGKNNSKHYFLVGKAASHPDVEITAESRTGRQHFENMGMTYQAFELRLKLNGNDIAFSPAYPAGKEMEKASRASYTSEHFAPFAKGISLYGDVIVDMMPGFETVQIDLGRHANEPEIKDVLQKIKDSLNLKPAGKNETSLFLSSFRNNMNSTLYRLARD